MSETSDGWTITTTSAATSAARRGSTIDEERVAELLDQLVDYDPVVAIAPDNSRLVLTVSLPGARAAADAVKEGARLHRTHAKRVGLPSWPIVRADAMTWDEHDRDLAEPAYPELAGVAEIAETLHVSAQRVSTMQRTHDGFPAPIAKLRSGPVWVRAHITSFADSWARKPGRPSKSG